MTQITLKKEDLSGLVQGVQAGDFGAQHLIISLSPDENWNIKDLKPLLAVAKLQNEQYRKAVVVVSAALASAEADSTLNIVPTVQEALDLIELEEIERELWS